LSPRQPDRSAPSTLLPKSVRMSRHVPRPLVRPSTGNLKVLIGPLRISDLVSFGKPDCVRTPKRRAANRTTESPPGKPRNPPRRLDRPPARFHQAPPQQRRCLAWASIHCGSDAPPSRRRSFFWSRRQRTTIPGSPMLTQQLGQGRPSGSPRKPWKSGHWSTLRS